MGQLHLDQPRLVSLRAADIDRIVEGERRAFEAPLQASRQLELQRFALGHFMLGVEKRGQLVGTIKFSYVRFALDELFPWTHESFSRQPTPQDYDTLAMYSLGIEPAGRGFACARLLAHSCLEQARREGCRQALATARIPSFAGNDQVRARPGVRAMIERYVQTGRFPPQEEFLSDPLLALYHRLSGARFLRLLRDYAPQDRASGGWQALLYMTL